MTNLGYKWYPLTWWGSDAFIDLPPLLRYVYLEILSSLYMHNNAWKVTPQRIKMKWHVDLSEDDYNALSYYFNIDDNGVWSSDHVKVRIAKADAARENGKKGGRPPKKSTKPKTQKPNPLTQQNQRGYEKNNPPYKIEIEKEIEIESKREHNAREFLSLDERINNDEIIKRIYTTTGLPAQDLQHWLDQVRLKIITEGEYEEYTTKQLRARIEKYLRLAARDTKNLTPATNTKTYKLKGYR